jgi:hypothetical protein
MKTSSKLYVFAVASAAALSLSAQTTLSDFSSSTGLGSSTVALGNSAAISVSGGVANYTVATPTAQDFAYVAYTGAVGSYTSNWSVRVDVNYAAGSSIFTPSTAQFVNLGLMVVPTGVTPVITGGGPTFNGFAVESNLYSNAANAYNRDIRTAVFSPGNALDAETRYAQQFGGFSTTQTAVQISFDATTKTLMGHYDANGATGGYSFSSMTDLTANAGGWGMTDASTFSLYVMGASGNDAGGLTGVTIGTGLATLDNLTGTGLTAIPEPSSYAAMAGALALGLVVWRRKHARAA